METDQKKDRLLPYSIAFAAILIAGSLVYSAGKSEVARDTGPAAPVGDTFVPSPDNVAPVTDRDHIKGNPAAPVKIVEFSDFECIFCKNFHPTMKTILEEYEGQVAWVYRHFVTGLFSKSDYSAAAAECAAEQGGDNAFWAFADEYFATTPSNNLIDLAEIPRIAERVGLDRNQLEECIQSGRHDERIREHTDNAVASGAQGTPYSVVIGPDGRTDVINGNQPLEVVRLIIERALR